MRRWWVIYLMTHRRPMNAFVRSEPILQWKTCRADVRSGLTAAEKGPRMADQLYSFNSLPKFYIRNFATVAVMFSALLSAGGCQTAAIPDAELPPAIFGSSAAPKVAVAPKPVAPPIKVRPLSQPQNNTAIPAGWVPPVATRPWRWIVVHHSATPTGGAAAFDAMHRAKGWDELGYDFVIGNGTDTGDGQIEVGPRWTKQKQGAHAKTPDNKFNEYGIGICLVGNFDNQRPTPAQLRSLTQLSAYLMHTYHIGVSNILGHRDTKATECPGRNINIDDVRRMANQINVATGYGTETENTRTASSRELLVNSPTP